MHRLRQIKHPVKSLRSVAQLHSFKPYYNHKNNMVDYFVKKEANPINPTNQSVQHFNSEAITRQCSSDTQIKGNQSNSNQSNDNQSNDKKNSGGWHNYDTDNETIIEHMKLAGFGTFVSAIISYLIGQYGYEKEDGVEYYKTDFRATLQNYLFKPFVHFANGIDIESIHSYICTQYDMSNDNYSLNQFLKVYPLNFNIPSNYENSRKTIYSKKLTNDFIRDFKREIHLPSLIKFNWSIDKLDADLLDQLLEVAKDMPVEDRRLIQRAFSFHDLDIDTLVKLAKYLPLHVKREYDIERNESNTRDKWLKLLEHKNPSLQQQAIIHFAGCAPQYFYGNVIHFSNDVIESIKKGFKYFDSGSIEYLIESIKCPITIMDILSSQSNLSNLTSENLHQLARILPNKYNESLIKMILKATHAESHDIKSHHIYDAILRYLDLSCVSDEVVKQVHQLYRDSEIVDILSSGLVNIEKKIVLCRNLSPEQWTQYASSEYTRDIYKPNVSAGQCKVSDTQILKIIMSQTEKHDWNDYINSTLFKNHSEGYRFHNDLMKQLISNYKPTQAEMSNPIDISQWNKSISYDMFPNIIKNSFYGTPRQKLDLLHSYFENHLPSGMNEYNKIKAIRSTLNMTDKKLYEIVPDPSTWNNTISRLLLPYVLKNKNINHTLAINLLKFVMKNNHIYSDELREIKKTFEDVDKTRLKLLIESIDATKCWNCIPKETFNFISYHDVVKYDLAIYDEIVDDLFKSTYSCYSSDTITPEKIMCILQMLEQRYHHQQNQNDTKKSQYDLNILEAILYFIQYIGKCECRFCNGYSDRDRACPSVKSIKLIEEKLTKYDIPPEFLIKIKSKLSEYN